MDNKSKSILKRLTDKVFGGINLTWQKVIIAAVIAGVITAVIAIIPQLRYTSFIGITVTFEVWILFGIIIIMNSKSNLDSELMCFVFFQNKRILFKANGYTGYFRVSVVF